MQRSLPKTASQSIRDTPGSDGPQTQVSFEERTPSAVVVTGGYHPNANPSPCWQEADFVPCPLQPRAIFDNRDCSKPALVLPVPLLWLAWWGEVRRGQGWGWAGHRGLALLEKAFSSLK